MVQSKATAVPTEEPTMTMTTTTTTTMTPTLAKPSAEAVLIAATSALSVPVKVKATGQHQRPLTIEDLPIDLYERIFAPLPLAYVHRFRLAGAGSRCARLHAGLRALLRRRVRRAQDVFHGMDAGNVYFNFRVHIPFGWDSAPWPLRQTILHNADLHHIWATFRNPGESEHPPAAEGAATATARGSGGDSGSSSSKKNKTGESTASAWPPQPDAVSLMSDLCASNLSPRAATAAAREFPNLKVLRISRPQYKSIGGPFHADNSDHLHNIHDNNHNNHSNNNSNNSSNNNQGHHASDVLNGGVQYSVPRELEYCTQLRVLSLCHLKSEVISQVVVRLSNLFELHLCKILGLRQFPDDLGARLSKLMYIEIEDCPIIDVPDSLLDTLERNFEALSKTWLCGIRTENTAIPYGFWEARLDQAKYPTLGYHIFKQKGAYLPQDDEDDFENSDIFDDFDDVDVYEEDYHDQLEMDALDEDYYEQMIEEDPLDDIDGGYGSG